jgi:hypothetical protein
MSLGISVKIPIIVRIRKIGAIFMAENPSSGDRISHFDTRYHLLYLLQEHAEDGFMKINFLNIKEND